MLGDLLGEMKSLDSSSHTCLSEFYPLLRVILTNGGGMYHLSCRRT